MATELTSVPAASTVAPRSDIEFRPLDWWVELDGATIGGATIDDPQRRTPPIPAFVRLSRLVDPNKIATARGIEAAVSVEPPLASRRREPEALGPELKEVGSQRATRGGWAESAGRPLFRVGLAAIVAAVAVAFSTFGPRGEEMTTGDTTGTDEQTRQVLEALVRQASDDAEADLSIVGTASATGTDIRWTATIRNEGPDTAEGPITVVQTIGSDFELTAVAGTGWDCRHMRSADTITCELDEELAIGQRRRLGLVTTMTGVDPGTSIPSTVSVVAGTADPKLGDNTVNVTGVTAPADDAAASRSRSTGAAGHSDSDSNTDPNTDATVGASATGSDQATAAGMEELPRTGSGLVAVLGVVGIGLCLAGRRLMTWSSRAQTRTLLVNAKID